MRVLITLTARKKCWEELITYFPLTGHGLQTKYASDCSLLWEH
jgi:hypothetical protein